MYRKGSYPYGCTLAESKLNSTDCLIIVEPPPSDDALKVMESTVNLAIELEDFRVTTFCYVQTHGEDNAHHSLHPHIHRRVLEDNVTLCFSDGNHRNQWRPH